MAARYSVDLSQPGNQVLIPPSTPIGSLTVVQLPGGCPLPLTLGGTVITALYAVGQIVRLCGMPTDGLTVTVPSGLVGQLLVIADLEDQGPPTALEGRQTSYAGGAYVVSAGNGAGAVSLVELQNPAGSGRVVVVRSAAGFSSIGGLYAILTTSLLGAAVAATFSHIAARTLGAPGGVAKWMVANNVATAPVGTPAGWAAGIGGTGTVAQPLPLIRPQPILPGNALRCVGSFGANGANVGLTAEWDEV